MIVAGVIGLAAGWIFPQFQHHLYTEQSFREEPAHGRRLLALRTFSGVAASAGLALAFRPDHYDLGPAALSAAFVLILVAVSSTDFDRRRIPNKVTYPAALFAIAVCWAWPDRSVADIALGGAAGVGAAVLLVGIGVVVGGGDMGLGIGDGKLMILMGLVGGWPAFVPALFYGILGAGVVAVVLMVRAGRKAKFSYGPYLAAGAAILLLFPGLA